MALHRTRLTIFALFWALWVMVLPFAHHHLVRAPREGIGIHCGGKSCAVQCVACVWGSSSTAEIEQTPLFVPPLEVPDLSTLASPSVCRILPGGSAPRAPPLG